MIYTLAYSYNYIVNIEENECVWIYILFVLPANVALAIKCNLFFHRNGVFAATVCTPGLFDLSIILQK